MTDTIEGQSAADVRAKHGEFLFRCVANYYAEPVVLESGSGLRVRDVDGREYLDFFGGILTVSIGPLRSARHRVRSKRRSIGSGHVSTPLPHRSRWWNWRRDWRSITPGPPVRSRIFNDRPAPRRTTPRSCWRRYTPSALEIIALRHGYSGTLASLAQALTGARSVACGAESQVAGDQARDGAVLLPVPARSSEYPKCGMQCAPRIWRS